MSVMPPLRNQVANLIADDRRNPGYSVDLADAILDLPEIAEALKLREALELLGEPWTRRVLAAAEIVIEEGLPS